MPLLSLFPILNLITGRAWVYIALAGMAGSFLGGYWVKGKFEQAKQVTAITMARVAERDAAAFGNEADRGYLNKLRGLKDRSDESIRKLRRQLAVTKPCAVPVPAEWMRQHGSVPNATRDASRSQPTGETVVTADSRDVVLTCERNRLEVHQPNVEQIEAMQLWYESLRQRYNK